MAKYLDYDGLLYFWQKLKTKLASKADSSDVPTATTTTPKMNGTAAVGSETTKFARGDHVHPSDTTKVDKETGKGLSTNDYTTDEKNKLAGINAGAEVNQNSYSSVAGVNTSWSVVANSVNADIKTAQLLLMQGNNITLSKQTNVAQGIEAIKITSTDTKNTAGSTDSSSKLFIVGAESQAGNPQTYSQDTAYVGTDGHLYSNSKQTVNLSDTQSLTNKTYNGYTLASACAKGVDTSISAGSSSTNLPTTAAVEARITAAIEAAQTGAATFKGTVNASTDISGLTAYSAGWYWVVGTAGTYAGQACETGDMIFAIANRGSSTSNDDFDVVQNNLITITNSEIDTIIAS